MLVNSFAADEIQSGDMFLAMLEGKRESLLTVDPTFVVEMAWVSYVSGPGGVKEFQSNVSACFPADGKHCTLEGTFFLAFFFL